MSLRLRRAGSDHGRWRLHSAFTGENAARDWCGKSPGRAVGHGCPIRPGLPAVQ